LPSRDWPERSGRSGRSGPSFELMESKLRPPAARRGIVARTALVDQLLAASGASVLSVAAPPGYGKTTLLGQWARRKEPRVGWVTVDRSDNDPAILLTYLAVALDRVEPIDPEIFRILASPGAWVAASVVLRLAAAMSAMRQPVDLVVDQIELLDNPRSLDAVAELAARLPSGSQLALASRVRPPLPAALLRAGERVVKVGVEELAMDQREARALLEGAEVRLDEPQATELARRTEGWPVGLYLAALALKAGTSQADAHSEFTGDDRLVADYLRSEMLSRLPGPTVSFLTRTAVLERMCGPLCDAVLEARWSSAVLASLAASNLLLVPLDRHDQWYRYHHLFRELLRAELERREPELVPQLHLRAAGWYQANGLPEAAIDHAQAAAAADQVAGLVARLALPTYASGRVDKVRRWMAWFEDRGLIERYPPVAVLGAMLYALLGRAATAERWADAAERGPAAGSLPDGSTMASYLATLRALLCRAGLRRMRADAELAWDQLAPGNQLRAGARFLEGLSYLLEGEIDRADPILADAVEVATHAGAMPAASAALAECAQLAIDRQDWPQAATLAERAQTIVRAGRLDDYVLSAHAYAVVARVAVHRNDLPRAHEHLARAARLRPLLSHALPYYAVQTLLELTRAYLALDDPGGARATLRQARQVLLRRPDLGILPRQAQELQAKLTTSHGGAAGSASLTSAELRLLPLLATHLSFREIGQRLYVSQHTVKSQAMSIYRKLDVSSRSQAIQRARQIGLSR
jgi:LuxR family transcriptional regulator, maltose regulon positive regulatory protein